jgi:hypothetical protein
MNWQNATYALDCTYGNLSYCGASATATTASYELAVYELMPNNFTFSAGESIGITFDNEAIDGSMLVAYSCDSSQSNASACTPSHPKPEAFGQKSIRRSRAAGPIGPKVCCLGRR